MKLISLFLLAVCSIQTAFAEPAIENLEKMIKADPTHSFVKGSEFANVAKDKKSSSLSFAVEKKGSRPLADFAWSLVNVTNYTKGLFYYQKMDQTKGYMTTISFTDSSGSQESIECFVVDFYECGKRFFEKCTTSKSGYSLGPKLLEPVYDEALYNQCLDTKNVFSGNTIKSFDKNNKNSINPNSGLSK